MNTDKLMELAYEAGWRNCAKWADRNDLHADVGSPAYVRDRDAALRAEQAVGDDQRARELLAAEYESGEFPEHNVAETLRRNLCKGKWTDDVEYALRAIRRALGTARQSEPRQNFMGKGQTIAAQVLHAARQSEGVVPKLPAMILHDSWEGTARRFSTWAKQDGHKRTLLGQTMEEAAAFIRHYLAAAPGGEGEGNK